MAGCPTVGVHYSTPFGFEANPGAGHDHRDQYQQMEEAIETNMENGKKEEAQGSSEFQALKLTKSEQLSAANSKEELEDIAETMYADMESLTWSSC